jgi:hypothetical protein
MRPAISKGAGRKSCVEQRNHLFRSICRATDLPDQYDATINVSL